VTQECSIISAEESLMLQEAATTPSMATMDSDTIRILLVDDHTILREGLAAVLNAIAGFEVVGQAAEGKTALASFIDLQPDVAIVDLRMQPMDGVELTKALREQNPNARVILLTTYDTDEEIFRGLRAGAASYLLKDVDSSRLADTIRSVHAGRKEIPPEIAAKLADHVASETLTPRQEEVLRGVAEGKSNLEIGARESDPPETRRARPDSGDYHRDQTRTRQASLTNPLLPRRA
jgi:two-component system NarL family response regulator